MNYVSFSPHFPPNFYPFCVELRRRGVSVLGLGDTPFEDLRPELRGALTEYYRVQNMHNYNDLVRALGYFTFNYGKIDRFESHNEYWLETDALLRDDFNVPGLRTSILAKIKRKSEMKKVYQSVDIPVARGMVARNYQEALQLVEQTGFPLVAKPDIGVGANKTYRIDSLSGLKDFFVSKPPVDYILEEFVNGTIVTFDGLVDQDGQIVFASSMEYSQGVMDLVNGGLDFTYWTLRDIPDDLVEYGCRLVEAYGLRERFFHFEFFRMPDGSVVALEVNMRPPGGLTTDMWNYANNIDIYSEYANIVTTNRFEAEVSYPYYCAYLGRRLNKAYTYSPVELMKKFPEKVVHHEAISGIFASAIGDYGILVRSPDFEEVQEIAQIGLEKA
jgi:hypothetical protein